HLDLEAAVGDDVAALSEPATVGQRPELVEARPVDLHLRLPPREPGPALRGEQELLPHAPNPHLALGADREVPLLDLVRVGSAELREPRHDELPLDLHADTVDWAGPDRGARGTCGLR